MPRPLFVDQILTTSYAREDHYYCAFWCLFKSLGGDLSRMRRMNVPLAHLGSVDYVPHLMAHPYSNGNRTCYLIQYGGVERDFPGTISTRALARRGFES